MKPTIKCILDNAQVDFQEGRGTVEQICNIRILNEKYIEHQKWIYHNFIDFKKAFNRVWHDALRLTMQKHNINQTIVKAIKLLYEHAKSTVRIGDRYSNRFTAQVDIRKGCILSPDLFHPFLEQIMKEALEHCEGRLIDGGKQITTLSFADDIDLLCSTEKELRSLTTRLDATARAYGMEISAEKSKITIAGKEERKPNREIEIAGEKLEQVKTFEYLGSIITEDGKSTEEIRIRLASVTASLVKLVPLRKVTNITLKTKIRLLRTITLAIALYGCESWLLDATSEKGNNAFEMKCYRRLLRMPYTAH